MRKETLRLEEMRHELHQFPELSGAEKDTAQRIEGFLNELSSTFTFTREVGGTGLVAELNFGNEGPRVALRAELDALPIKQISSKPYRSQRENVAHLCGHDGHMMMLCGAAARLLEKPPRLGSLVLVFQTAEETGEGATRMLQDPRLSEMNFASIYAIHNIPGEPLGTVLIRSQTMAMASCGLIFSLIGRETHSSHPERGASAVPVIAHLIQEVKDIQEEDSESLATVVGIKSGGRAFGIAAADGEVCITVRALATKDLSAVIQRLTDVARMHAARQDVEVAVQEVEPFDETFNSEEEVRLIQEIASRLGLTITSLQEPYRWSEDFGVFVKRWPGALIGLGAGENQPPLHDPKYDFPDALLPVGSRLLEEIVRTRLEQGTYV